MMFKYSKICERFVKSIDYRNPPPEECPPAPPPPPEKPCPPLPLEGEEVIAVRAEAIVELSEVAKARVL